MDSKLVFAVLLGVLQAAVIHGAAQQKYIKEDIPMFTTVGQTYRVTTGDTIVLPCDTTNLGKYLLAWKRGIAVLTAGPTKITPDDRFRLVDGYNLEISDVQTKDAGDYICQIGTIEPQEITHTVEILVPPRIQKVTSDGLMVVKKGTTLTLECKASGNPVPTISWSRKNNLLPNGDKSVDGFSLNIPDANRHHAGIYQCTASNGVGNPVTQEIQLQVLYAPEIEPEKTWVHSGIGVEAHLVCIVHAEPESSVLWYRDTLLLDTTEKRIMESRGSRHTLMINNVQPGDFGNYSCVADNNIGRDKKYLELSGKPNVAEFLSNPEGRYQNSYNITWAVDSYTPVEEFQLYYMKLSVSSTPTEQPPHRQSSKRPSRRNNDTYGFGNGHSGWRQVVIKAVRPNGQRHLKWYEIKGLDPAAMYEAKVESRNRFGWSKPSKKFQFFTSGTDYYPYEPSPAPAVFTGAKMSEVRESDSAASIQCHLTASVLAFSLGMQIMFAVLSRS